MQSKPSSWTIVLAGVWNRAIFAPEWVAQHLFHAEEVEIMLASSPVLPIVYQNQSVSIEVGSSRLIFRVRIQNDDCLNSAERMALTVLERLPETPINAVGINFSYIESTPNADLMDLFNFADNGGIAGNDWQIATSKITRQIKKNDDNLNCSLSFSGSEITLDFNYHTEAADNAAARQAVTQRCARLRELSERFASEVYLLQIEQG